MSKDEGRGQKGGKATTKEVTPGGCQDGCPLGKVLGGRECPGKKVKERVAEWLRGEAQGGKGTKDEGGK